jgi:hypothetical protein
VKSSVVVGGKGDLLGLVVAHVVVVVDCLFPQFNLIPQSHSRKS